MYATLVNWIFNYVSQTFGGCIPQIWIFHVLTMKQKDWLKIEALDMERLMLAKLIAFCIGVTYHKKTNTMFVVFQGERQ